MRRLGLLLVLATAVLAPAAPAAADAPDASSASDQFAGAKKLFAEGRHEEALPMFRAALEASKSPNARLYVARSLAALGRLAEAYEEMKTTLDAAAKLSETEPKYEPTRDAAAAELSTLERKVARVVVALVDVPDETSVTIGDARLDIARLGAPVAVMPGTVVIVATAPDGAHARREVQIGPGEIKSVALMLKSAEKEGEPPPPVIAPAGPTHDQPPPAPSGGSGLRTVGWIATGVGIAGLATFGVAAAMADAKFSKLKNECGGTRCSDPKYADDVDSGKSFDTIANVGLVVGAVGVVGGVGILLFSPSGAGAQPSQSAWLAVDPHGARLRFRQSF